MRGLIVNSSGAPLQGAEVTDSQTGATTTTDAAGAFTLETDIKSRNPSLLVKTIGGVDQMVTLQNVPAGSTEVVVRLEVNEIKGIISVASVEVVTTPTTSPTPTPQPSSGGSGGGETSPTPSSTAQWNFTGSVVDGKGAPLSGVAVLITPGSSKTSTGSNGSFSLSLKGKGTSATISISYRGLSGSATVRGLPTTGTAAIKVALVAIIESSEIDPNDPNSQPHTVLNVQVSSVSVR